MKKSIINKFLSFTRSYSLFSIYLFAIYSGCYAIISHFVFHNYNFPLNYMFYIFIVSLIVATLLYGIMRIDFFSQVSQALIIYLIITISIFIVGFLTKCFTMNLAFWISTLIINLIAFSIIMLFIIIKGNKENRDLNEKLKTYKEREH